MSRKLVQLKPGYITHLKSIFLQALTKNKWPLGIDLGGHNLRLMSVLNCSINNTHFRLGSGDFLESLRLLR